MADRTDTSDEACALVCMIVSNPQGAMRKDGDGWQKRVNDLIRALRDERNEMRGALQPFADESVMFEDTPDDLKLKARNEDGDIEELPLTVGALRRAKASLSPKPSTPHPTGSEEFAGQLERLGVPAPWRLCDEEVGEILASNGGVACHVVAADESGLPDENHRTEIAMYIILAVNTLAGFKAEIP